MLVLSRKRNESVAIGDDITVTVVEIRGDRVRLGIIAPKEVSVHREEIWVAIHKERKDASSSKADSKASGESPVTKRVDPIAGNSGQ